jgi:hypothetical protein
MAVGVMVGVFAGIFVGHVVAFAVAGALFGMALEQLKGNNIVRPVQPSSASDPSKPSKTSSVGNQKMKTHEREHHMTMVLLTAGIGGMVLGFGVYSFTHFAPAIFCGVVLSVLFTLFVTRDRK